MSRNKKLEEKLGSDSSPPTRGEVFSRNFYKNRVLLCHRCGKDIGKAICESCSSEIKIRQHVLTDFIIGAHTLQTEDQSIVTHDTGYYSTYFPELNIISTDI